MVGSKKCEERLSKTPCISCTRWRASRRLVAVHLGWKSDGEWKNHKNVAMRVQQVMVTYLGKRIELSNKKFVYYVLHKPAGYRPQTRSRWP